MVLELVGGNLADAEAVLLLAEEVEGTGGERDVEAVRVVVEKLDHRVDRTRGLGTVLLARVRLRAALGRV